MTRLRAALRAFELPLVAPLATAHGTITTRHGHLIRIEDAEGRVGFGEASPLPEFGTETRSECERALVTGLTACVDTPEILDTRTAETLLARCSEGRMTAHAALESALADLTAQRGGWGLAEHWRRRAGIEGVPARSVAVQALVGGETAQAVFASASAARRLGHTVFKLKLAVSPAARDISRELERVAALREAVGRSARIRLDANEAWSLDVADEALARLAQFEIEYVEQPVARNDLEALARLDEEAPVRVAADEALLGAGLERCLERRAARIFIVKPAAIGGFESARRLVERARALGIRIIWSSLLDGAVSRLAALQLAAALGSDDEVHGLGTGPWLAADFPGGPEIDSGRLALPTAAGLGIGSAWRDASAFDAEASYWVGPARWFGAER